MDSKARLPLIGITFPTRIASPLFESGSKMQRIQDEQQAAAEEIAALIEEGYEIAPDDTFVHTTAVTEGNMTYVITLMTVVLALDT